MKLWPVTKLDQGNKTTWRKFRNDVISENCDVIAIFSIYNQSGAIWKPDSGSIVCKIYIFINSHLLSYKDLKLNQKISTVALTLLLWVKVIFWPKIADFLQKNAQISKMKRALVLQGIFSETTYVCVYLRTKFEVSNQFSLRKHFAISVLQKGRLWNECILLDRDTFFLKGRLKDIHLCRFENLPVP